MRLDPPKLPPERRAPRLHEIDRRVTDAMLVWDKEQRPQSNVLLEAHEVVIGGDAPITEASAQLLVPWALYHDQSAGDAPLGRRFLDARGGTLAAEERALLEAQVATRLSVWEILRADQGRGLLLHDLLAGEERYVFEVRGSAARPLMSLLARVVDYHDGNDGISVFGGIHHRLLPPDYTDKVVDSVASLLGEPGSIAPERLRTPEVERILVTRWREVVEDLDNPILPHLVNRDGDTIRHVTDTFVVRRGARLDILDRLDGEADVVRTSEVTFTIVGRREGARGSISIADVQIAVDRLTITSNSRERADRLRPRIEALCEGLVDFAGRRERDPLDGRAGRRDPLRAQRIEHDSQLIADEGGPPPSVAAIKTEHFRAWLDRPNPGLDGMTPRAAATDPRMRRRLERTLREVEWREQGIPAAERADLRFLWKELDYKPLC